MEQAMGIEPTSQPWEGRILPMYYTCRKGKALWPIKGGDSNPNLPATTEGRDNHLHYSGRFSCCNKARNERLNIKLVQGA